MASGKLSGKTALVTGANSGIGKACVDRFIKEGAKVIASDITSPEIKLPNVSYQICDVTETVSVKNVIKYIEEEYGELHIIVNSAGIAPRHAAVHTSDPEEIWDRVIEVNLKGTYLVSYHAIPLIHSSGGGSIINIASIMGMIGYPEGWEGGALKDQVQSGYNAYPPSKGAVIQFTKNLGIAQAQNGIRVNCICPGYIETNLIKALTSDTERNEWLKELHPMGRIGKASEIANGALFLASDESSFMTGSSLVIDGGYTAQ